MEMLNSVVTWCFGWKDLYYLEKAFLRNNTDHRAINYAAHQTMLMAMSRCISERLYNLQTVDGLRPCFENQLDRT